MVNPNRNLSREFSANPFADENIEERYSENKITDMRGNYIIEKNDSGYLVIRPIDKNKTY